MRLKALDELGLRLSQWMSGSRQYHLFSVLSSVISLLWCNLLVTFYQIRFSMGQHEWVSINSPPHSEACFCFALGVKWWDYTMGDRSFQDWNPDSHCWESNLSLSYPVMKPKKFSDYLSPLHITDLGLCLELWCFANQEKHEEILKSAPINDILVDKAKMFGDPNFERWMKHLEWRVLPIWQINVCWIRNTHCTDLRVKLQLVNDCWLRGWLPDFAHTSLTASKYSAWCMSHGCNGMRMAVFPVQTLKQTIKRNQPMWYVLS